MTTAERWCWAVIVGGGVCLLVGLPLTALCLGVGALLIAHRIDHATPV